MLKRIAILAVLATSPALAQQAPQSAETLQADCNIIEGQLATQLGQAQHAVIQLKAQVADLQKQLDAAKAEAAKSQPDTKTEPPK